MFLNDLRSAPSSVVASSRIGVPDSRLSNLEPRATGGTPERRKQHSFFDCSQMLLREKKRIRSDMSGGGLPPAISRIGYVAPSCSVTRARFQLAEMRGWPDIKERSVFIDARVTPSARALWPLSDPPDDFLPGRAGRRADRVQRFRGRLE